MSERDAEFLQVGRVEVRQGSKVDVIRGEDLGVFAEADTVQPLLDGGCHAGLRFWLALRHYDSFVYPAVGSALLAASGVGGRTVIRAEDLENFRQGLRGRLITPGDADYDEARALYNGMIDKRPLLIARCADVADVIAAVNFGRDERPAHRDPRRRAQRPGPRQRATTAWSSTCR